MKIPVPVKSGSIFPWIIRSLLLGCTVGPVIALLTKTVEAATFLRMANPKLLFAIPLGAITTAFLYQKVGPYLKDGSNQVMSMINQGIVDIAHPTSIAYQGDYENHSNKISTKMAPLLLLNTFITHLVGASGGKEGVGVQLGASLGSYLDSLENLLFPQNNTQLKTNKKGVWLISGAGSAFAALFNAPIAGTLFGLQFSSPRVNRTDAILPCFLSSCTACFVSQALHIHTLTPIQAESFPTTVRSLACLTVLSIAVGLTSRLFCFLVHLVKQALKAISPNPILQALICGTLLLCASIGIYLATGSVAYNGLSSSLLTEASLGTSSKAAPLLKLLLTTLTIGSGFVGGEVIPIMVIGSTTGSLFAHYLSLPFSAMAMFGAMGMLSGATKLPFACFVLGLELFGYGDPLTLFFVCCVAYIASGKPGIYENQIAPVSIDESWEV
ncbi:chloride channel protein EriC [Sphaerochaeta pleomorpha str. Grapes]|uniref:Chloride channel protein EriC n=1 Tax=Sphaerochaeta pleomorpha (strain ATCC BAA-1885 / DSM 22778 / Grapes) TaxID=158190 RepID=G8QXV9_SPHPG|nr:chloride channel protein [Sphaerochaeta pleomorpha]AEV28464.1 chloride channel protein EriC [Sphaerochaeta pleomorpha str. Grapes]